MNWLGRIRVLACCGFAVSTLLVAACGSSAADTVPAVGADQGSSGQDQASNEETSTGETSGDGAAESDAASDESETDDQVEELFPDVIGAIAELETDGTWTFAATLSSPYDTPERYADGWRVVGPDGTVYGERPLGHDHQAEQPFTRSQSGIEIPEDITEVTVEGRDQLSGWGGATVQVILER